MMSQFESRIGTIVAAITVLIGNSFIAAGAAAQNSGSPSAVADRIIDRALNSQDESEEAQVRESGVSSGRAQQLEMLSAIVRELQQMPEEQRAELMQFATQFIEAWERRRDAGEASSASAAGSSSATEAE